MNVSDTERARAAVTEAGYSLADNVAQADVVMLNTCSVRAKAERKVFGRIDELHYADKTGKQIIGVMGCVAQLEGENLFDNKGKVSLVVGTQAIKRLPILLKTVSEQGRVLDLGPGIVNNEQFVTPSLRHSAAVAFVPIIEGCNKFCSYCIVPYSRGRERSRPALEIIDEVLKLRDSGVKEVHLIGQNVNSYRPASDNGLQNIKGGTPFVKLLKAVAKTDIKRVKFTTSFPRDFHIDIVQALEEYSNLCNWVHLPVQSGSNKILKTMRRGYTREEYLEKAEKINKSPKQIALTTDIIVGYPGETEDDFYETLNLMQICEFDGSYLFNYSPRSGTPAYNLADSVPEEQKSIRFNRLDKLQREIQVKKLKNLIGKTLEILVEKISPKDSNAFTGHSSCHKLVNFIAPDTEIGQIVNVKITEIKRNSLFGELII